MRNSSRSPLPGRRAGSLSPATALSLLLLFTSIALKALPRYGEDDSTAAKPGTSAEEKSYKNYSHGLILGARVSNYSNSFRFRNITANLAGAVYRDFLYDKGFPLKEIANWTFDPSLNRNFVSLMVVCRYITLSHSWSISETSGRRTELKAYNLTLPYKNIALTVDHSRFRGFRRAHSLLSDFRENMSIQPTNIFLEYTGTVPKWVEKLGALKNSYLYCPRETVGALSMVLGYSGLLMHDPGGIIPTVEYADPPGNKSIQISDRNYLQKFTSHGGMFGARLSGFIPVFTRDVSADYFRSLYFKVSWLQSVSVQFWKFHSDADFLSNPQFLKYQKGNSPASIYEAEAGIVYDLGNMYLAANFNFYMRVFGSDTRSFVSGNHVRDKRQNFQITAAYRFIKVFRPKQH